MAAMPLNPEVDAFAAVARMDALGVHLMPLKPGVKAPLAKGWPIAPAYSAEEAQAYVRRGGNLGVNLIASRLIVLDAEDALATAAVAAAGFRPTVYPAKSQAPANPNPAKNKRGGSHTWLRVPADLDPAKIRSDRMGLILVNGGKIDVLANARYAVAPPSRLDEAPGYFYAPVAGGLADPSAPLTDIPEAPRWLFDRPEPGQPDAPPSLISLHGILAPETPYERMERSAASEELTAKIDAISWEDWLAGDARLTPTGVYDGRCGCPEYYFNGADNNRSATLHEGCELGHGAHVWSGTMRRILGLAGEHFSRLDIAAALAGPGVHRRDVAARVGIELRSPNAPVGFASVVELLESGGGDVDPELRASAEAVDARDAQRRLSVMASMQQLQGETRFTGAAVGADPNYNPFAGVGKDEGAKGDAEGGNVNESVVVPGLPSVDPLMAVYRERAEAEMGQPGFDVDWGISPLGLIPQDLRPLREAVRGPRATPKPVIVPARDAPVAQALAKAVGGTKLLRDAERSTRAAQANLSWDGTRWVNDPDAAGVVVDALLSTHMFDTEPAIRQQKVLVLGQRKPEPDEEQAQLEAAKEAARLAGKAFDSAEFVPQPVFFHDQKWADAATRVAGLAQIMGRQPEVAIAETKRFDADSRMLGAEGGYVRLGADADVPFTVAAPDPAALITKKLGARFDSAAACPQWLRFLEQVLPDKEVREYLQRAVGLAMLGAVRAQVLLVLTGDGANGKGIVLKVLEAVFGDYAAALPSRTLTAKSQEEHPAALMPLRGARVGLIDELPEGIMWAENIIKVLTGGGTITARWMNENPQSWDPTHTLILATNGHPLVPPGSKAFWRRYREIMFTQSFATTADEWASGGYAGMADDGLEERLLTELPGILNWALAGYQAYLARGLDEPEAVLAAGRRARADSSSFATFAAEMFTVTGAPEDRIRTRDLWTVWSAYRREATELSNARPNSERDLWPLLIKELGKRVSHQKSTGGKSPACLLGVRWSEEGQELADRFTAMPAGVPAGYTPLQPGAVPVIGRMSA